MGALKRVDMEGCGRHYTPPALAAELVRRTLGPLRGGALVICDPACGDGALLAEACRFLRAAEAPAPRVRGVDVDGAAILRARRALGAFPGVEADLACADALRLDWADGSFDAVVANPPWASWSGRQRTALPDGDRREYARRFETWAAGWPSVHALFLELAVRICRGRAGLLLPAQVCELEGYGPARAFLRSRGEVEPPLHLGEGAFDGVTQPVCAIFVDRRVSGGRGGLAPFEADPVSPLDRCPRPPPDAFADIGVHTGNCAAKLLRPGGVPIREGRDVRAFELAPPRRTLLPDPPRADGDSFRIPPLERHREVPILLRQTAGRPIAALHTEPTWFRNSVLACRGIEGVEHDLVVAWLNSEVVAGYHQARVRESRQRAFPQLKVRHLRDLPCPPWAEATPRLRRLARAVAREGRLDLRPRLEDAVRGWFGL